ncbi:hypothetical protein, partial [Glaciecola sp. SC05]|uniref:hypothetical protein n=1 Tax=Glaciecola sp. SC05 TaxID=1987355 RepID=UPI0035273FC5
YVMKVIACLLLFVVVSYSYGAEFRVKDVLGVHSILNEEHTFVGYLYEPSVDLDKEEAKHPIIPLFLYETEDDSKTARSGKILIDVLTEYCSESRCNQLEGKRVKITGTIRKLDNWYSHDHALTDIKKIELETEQ